MSSPRIERIAYGGWPNNLRLWNADVELVVTLDVGPRIIRYAPLGGPNAFGEVAGQLGGTGETEWRIRGGHRLWISPEEPGRTYAPDNTPVRDEPCPGGVRLTAPPDAFGIEKTIEIRLAPAGSGVTVGHRVRNLGPARTELAPWALTVLARNGVALAPLPERRASPHPVLSAVDFAPSHTMAFWPSFSFDDPRMTLGKRFVQLRQDPTRGSTKLGIALRAGWAAYWNDGLLFVKRFPFVEGARYPDGGCNFECYTDMDLLELESLGPLGLLEPGVETAHEETWRLHRGVPAPSSEAEIAAAMAAVFAEEASAADASRRT
jgi:hypothetical protein